MGTSARPFMRPAVVAKKGAAMALPHVVVEGRDMASC
jgi:cytidylate kinase